MKYEIYQLDASLRSFVERAFRPLDPASPPNRAEYVRVYAGEIRQSEDAHALEALFYAFNVCHPKDFRGRSLSMSDVVLLDERAYYCDSVGWKATRF